MEVPGDRKLVVEVLETKQLEFESAIKSTIVDAKAFCKLQYDGQERSTRKVPVCLQPTWNEKFEFVIKNITMPGNLEIYFQVEQIYPGVTISVRCVHEGTGPEQGELCWYSLQSTHFSNGYLKLRAWIKREDRELRSIVGALPQLPSPPPDFSRNLGNTRNSERLMEDEGSSSAYINPVQSNPSCNPYDRHDLANDTNTLESMEGEIEQVINERMVAREAHLQQVIDLVNAHHSHVVEAFDLEARTEWQIHETLPLAASQLVAQSLKRSQFMVRIPKWNPGIQNDLAPRRVDDARDKERQLVRGVTNTARDAVNLQKWLRECDQTLFQADLALMEKQKIERMELFKTFQQEKEPHLNRWADSRRETHSLVQSIESNSQVIMQLWSTLVDARQRRSEYLVSLLGEWSDNESEAEVRQAVGGEAIEETSSSSVCQICCCNYLEGPSSSGTSTTAAHEQRSCLIPCFHAMICLPCATRIWESTKSCPFCKVTLTTKPRPLYLG